MWREQMARLDADDTSASAAAVARQAGETVTIHEKRRF
jgi:hypothetical protein